MTTRRLALLWVGSMLWTGAATAAPPVEPAVVDVARAPLAAPASPLLPVAPRLAQPEANMGPVIVMGVGAAAFGAGVALLSTAVWDKSNQCLGDTSCERQSQERILIGGVLMGVGVGGIATGVVIGVGGEKTATVGLSHRW